MKRLLVLLALAGAVAAPGRAQAQTIHVGLGGQLSSLVNLPITVPVVADLTGRPERLGSFALRVSWNPAVLQVLGGSSGTFGSTTVNQDSLAYGVARIAGANPAGAGGLVTLVNVQLLPLVKDTTTLALTVSELFAAGTFADLLPGATVAGGLFCPALGMWGDIDGDGNANSRDALIALSNAVGLDVSAFDITLGDVDANGVTNARDALIVLSNAVGIDTHVFRVLRLAGGACSSGAAVAMSIAPAAVTLVVGQAVQFEAWAPDSATGALQALPDATWRSGASAVLVVGPSGDAVARDTGTAVVTAFRGTKDSAQTSVHVLARRTTHWVDAQALAAKNRLGTPTLPFGSLEEGVAFAQDGDTLRVRVGRYAVQGGSLALGRALVVLGDTAADGSRPTLTGPGTALGSPALGVYAAGRTELRDLALEGFATGVLVDGADCVVLRGIRAHQLTTGVDVASPARCVRIERSSLLGSGTQLAYGQSYAAVVVAAALDTLGIDDTELAQFQQGLLLTTAPDSTAVRRSSLHDFLTAALADALNIPNAPRAWTSPRPAPRAPAPPIRRAPTGGGLPIVVIDSSRIERTVYSWGSLVDLYQGAPLDLVVSHSVLSNPGGNVVSWNVTGGSLALRADSIVAPPDRQHSYWLYAPQPLDSVVVDSLALVGAQSGYLYHTPLVRMTNATLREVRYTGLQLTFPTPAGGVLALDNVAVSGDPRDNASATGVSVSGGRVDANRFAGSNLNYGFDFLGDSSLTVANSQFQHVAYPVYWSPSSPVAPGTNGVTVRGTTFDGFASGVQVYDGTAVVDSSSFTAGQQAVYAYTPRPIAVTRNQVSGVQKAFDLNSFDSTATVTVTDNTVTGVPTAGIYVSGTSYQDALATRIDVERNTVTCDAAGATGAAGIELLEARLTVVDNQVGNCFAGIRTSVGTLTRRTDSIVGNTVAAPAGAQLGIGAAGNVAVRIGRNTVTGPSTGVQSNGLIDAPGVCGAWSCPDVGASVVTVDSNTVTGGTVWGIHVRDVDSVLIAGNTVTNLVTPSGAYRYTEDQGGIAVLGILRYVARIAGNVVRHIKGNGIVVNAGDTLTTVVDSNVVGDIDSTGVYFAYSGWTNGIAVTRNLLAGARRDGVRILGYGPAVVNGNNIEGNVHFGVSVLGPAGPIDGTGNWWNDPNGPTCPSGCLGTIGDSLQDSIIVNFASPLSAPNPVVPPMPVPAPPVLARATLPAPAATPAPARFPSAPRAAAGPPREVPQGLSAAAAARWAEGERVRAQLAAERAAHDQRLQDRRAARESARRAAHAPPAAPARQEVRP